jgi:uncharacterized protein DUF4232
VFPLCVSNTGRMHTLRLLAVTAALAVIAGCGGSPSNTSAGATSPPASAHSHAAQQHTASSSSATPSPSGPARCTTKDLRVALMGGEGAAGSTYYELTLTNTSGQACRTGGFGGVSLVGDGSGTQIGAPADRTESGKVRAITLQPDGQATATLRVTNAENYSPSKCDPAPAEGFRVYPPNETRAAYVAQGSTGCRNDTVHLLTLTPYQPVG